MKGQKGEKREHYIVIWWISLICTIRVERGRGSDEFDGLICVDKVSFRLRVIRGSLPRDAH